MNNPNYREWFEEEEFEEPETTENPEAIKKFRKGLEKSYWRQFKGSKWFGIILFLAYILGLIGGSYLIASYIVGRNANQPTTELRSPGRVRPRIQGGIQS